MLYDLADKSQWIIRPYGPPKPCSPLNSKLCCGGYLIDDPGKKTCCRWRTNVQKSLAPYLCGSSKSRSCGGFRYHSIREKCCYHQVIPIQSNCRRLQSGGRLYVTQTQQCCHGRVVPKSVSCQRPNQFTCGGVSFNPRTHECCSRRLMPKFMDVQCCRGKVIPASLPCLPCAVRCGRARFNTRTHKCCSGRLMPKTSWSVQCCNGQVIPARLPCLPN